MLTASIRLVEAMFLLGTRTLGRCSRRTLSHECGKTAVVKCADCGSAICSDCCTECWGDSFCPVCYEYHPTNSCLKKPIQNEPYPFRLPFGSSSEKAG
jgi:hypothetical protein